MAKKIPEVPTEEVVEAKPGDPNYQVPENEKALVKRFLKQIQNRLESKAYKDFKKTIERNRTYARGEQEDDGEGGLVRANLILPELKKAQNECYAKNPDISIAPTESVGKDRYSVWKDTGKTIEIVLRHQFSPAQANLKSKAKRCVRSADTAGFGWLKVIYQKNVETDPIAQQRMDDIQDNIQKIDRLMAELSDDTDPQYRSDQEAKKEELEQQLKAVEAQVEVVRSQGLNFIVRPSENVIFSEEVTDVEEIKNANWITDIIWMEVYKAKEQFGFCPATANKYGSKKDKEPGSSKTDEDDDYKLIKVFERWNKADKQIYTLAEGYEGYLRQPYTPRKLGERFHGFFPLAFDPTDGNPIPVPLTSQLIELQDEHNTARTNYKEHRELSVPFNVAHGGTLDPTDTEKLTNPQFMETVILKSAPEGQPLSNVFMHVQHPPIDPAVYSTQHVREDWEQITRRGDAARGTVAKTKTASEANILQENLAVDTSERKDVIEDWFREIVQYSMELVLQEMSYPEVQRIAGQGAVWPQIPREQIFDMVQLVVRAGTSGKPNKAQETQRWLDMLPQFREALLAIVEMRNAGKDKQADILTKLLRETIDRFDETIDLDALLPQEEETDEIPPEKLAEMQQQQTMISLQMKDLVSTIANRDADTMKKVAEAEAKEAGPQLQIYMTILQGLLNKQQQPTGSVQ